MPVPNAHQAHDATLIAGHAAGDLAGADLVLANRLLASCEDCARLRADLRAIAAATRSLPAATAAAAAAAAAPRDFRISPADAERLRRGGVLRRLLRPFAGPSAALRPMAATFSGLGALGLAVVLLLPAFGGPAALSLAEGGFRAAQEAGAPAEPNVEPRPRDNLAGPTGGFEGFGGATAAPGERPASLDGEQTGSGPEGGSNGAQSGGTPASPVATVNGATLLLIGSIVLLGLGLTLFGLRVLARRLT